MRSSLKRLSAHVLWLAVGAGVSCTSVTPQRDSYFRDKVLVIGDESAEQSFPFTESDAVHREVRHSISPDALTEKTRSHPYLTTEITYNYQPETQEFYEESRVTHPILPVYDGYGYSRWKLHFTAAHQGKATLLEKHPWGLRRYKVGQSVPFRVEPLP